MKLIAGCIFALLLGVTYNPALAQVPAAIHGKILQAENSAPADAATVVLLNSKDSTVVSSAISNRDGTFTFNSLHGGDYLLFITKLNYAKNYSGPYTVIEGKTTSAGTIILKPAAQQLNEVS